MTERELRLECLRLAAMWAVQPVDELPDGGSRRVGGGDKEIVTRAEAFYAFASDFRGRERTAGLSLAADGDEDSGVLGFVRAVFNPAPSPAPPLSDEERRQQRFLLQASKLAELAGLGAIDASELAQRFVRQILAARAHGVAGNGGGAA